MKNHLPKAAYFMSDGEIKMTVVEYNQTMTATGGTVKVKTGEIRRLAARPCDAQHVMVRLVK